MQQAAAAHETLVVVVIAVLAGALILFPSLALLFRLVLQGRLDDTDPAAEEPQPAPQRAQFADLLAALSSGLLARTAAACLLAGFGLLTVAEAGWAHAIGVVALFGFIVCGFFAIVPAQLAAIAGEHPASDSADER